MNCPERKNSFKNILLSEFARLSFGEEVEIAEEDDEVYDTLCMFEPKISR